MAHNPNNSGFGDHQFSSEKVVSCPICKKDCNLVFVIQLSTIDGTITRTTKRIACCKEHAIQATM